MEKRHLRDLQVFVVEDEWMIGVLIEQMLEEIGCKIVATASTLDDAIFKAGELTIDAALLDLNLDGMRSFAAADILAARGVPFVFASGYGAEALPERFSKTPIVAKPFQRRELERAFEKALRRQT